MNRKLAIIGASYLQLPLVLKAKEMGLETHCFAWAQGAVCKDYADYFYPLSITDKEKILEVCEKIGINGIVTIASDLAVVTVNYVSQKLDLPGNNPLYTHLQTNKYDMRNALQGISTSAFPVGMIQDGGFIPQFVKILDGADSDSDMPFEYPHIVKPTDRSGSRGVTKVYDKAHEKLAVERAMSESLKKEVVIEEFVGGREVSVESISYDGRHYVLQITDKVTTGEPYFVETAHHQPSDLSADIQDRIKALVPAALDALHITCGASHSEIKITDDGRLKIIEIGARMGGDFIGSHLVRLSTGYDYLKGVIQCALGCFEKPVMCHDCHSGVYFLSADTPDIEKYILNHEDYPEIIQCEITDPALRKIKESADRSGYFIYQSTKKFNIR